MGKIIVRLGINKPSALYEARMTDLGLYYLLTESSRVSRLKDRGYIDDRHFSPLHASLNAKINETKIKRDMLRKEHGDKLFVQSLHYLAISIEVKYLKELYVNAEVNETVYRKIKGKLNLQQEKIEYALHESINPSSYTDRKDVFERLVAFSQNAFSRSKSDSSLENDFAYYRAQTIIARKVNKVLQHMQSQYGTDVFYVEIFDKVAAIYDQHREEAAKKADRLMDTHRDDLAEIETRLSAKALHATGDKAIHFLESKGMIDEEVAELLEEHYSISSDPGHAGTR